MNAYGISFAHRRPGAEPYVSKDFAEFTAFAALCYSRGVAGAVKGVYFDTSAQVFNIDMDAKYELSPEWSIVLACAEAALSQFILFDTVGGREAL